MKRTPLLTIKQVRVISAVASYASLARASEQLNASQSSLSRSIAEVEGRLHQQLFARGWTGMEPTSQGEIVIARCRHMMSSIQAAQEALKASGARIVDLGHHLAWELLSAVGAIRKTGSVSAAAEYLERSQPDISRALAKIAAATGRPPFERTRAGMKATGDAVILADLHTKLLMDVMTLPEQLEALSGKVTGRVAVGLLPFSEQDVVVKVFGEMLSRHRHVRLQAVTGSYAALIDGLRQGELDFVIGPLREPPPYDVLEERHLFDEFFAVIARADHRLAKGRRKLKDLVGENWVVAPHGTPTRRYFEELLIGQGLVPPSQTCEIVTFALAEQMVMNSDVVALLTYSPAKLKTLAKGLKALAVELPANARAIGLTYRRDQPLTAAQQTFLEMLGRKAGKLARAI
ncbi:LysR family transcriptional regulator [Bradyrhizobium sp. CCGB01]|uniref:LysR family transcriptional regulator n=1 Tax=Bradyrhizobium sp. CCGB01 TaxID=2949634 RepID=UPI0020B31FE2|nr:LysR family transcriptional regulator [Bradyrhizobium sp. CCGB01]MCP3404659.1 LysR family transcriptional regulator [Bradyrhizobium sp. CCGB01]